MMTVSVQPRAFLVLGLVLATPAFAEITGTNLVARPAEITGTNLVARPAEITGTNLVARPAEITGTNLVARPAEITGTNLVARPAEITGTNRSAVVGSAVARSASFSSHGSARAVVKDARCESEVSMFDATCVQF